MNPISMCIVLYMKVDLALFHKKINPKKSNQCAGPGDGRYDRVWCKITGERFGDDEERKRKNRKCFVRVLGSGPLLPSVLAPSTFPPSTCIQGTIPEWPKSPYPKLP